MKKVLLLLLLFVSFSSFAQAVANTSQDDNLILEEVLKNTKKTLEGKYALILLSPSSNNNYVVNIIEKYRDNVSDVLFEADYNDEVLKQIFNKKEYEHLISQRSNEKWDISKIKVDRVLMYEEDMDIMATGSKVLAIGKPLYTLDKKYALVYLNARTWSGVDVFKNEEAKWSEYKLINPISGKPKAKRRKGNCMLLEKVLLNPKVAAYLHGDKKGRDTLYVVENKFCALDAKINGILVKTVKDAKVAKSKNYIMLNSVKEISEETAVQLSYPIEGVSIKAVFDSEDVLLDIDIIEK